METNSSKLNAVALYLLDLIVFGCVFICFGTGISSNNLAYARHASIFNLTFGEYAVLPMTITFFLLLAGVLLVAAAGTLIIKGKFKVGGTLGMISGIEVFVVGMLYFFTWAFVSLATGTHAGLHVATIFNGVLLVLTGVAVFFIGLFTKASEEKAA